MNRKEFFKKVLGFLAAAVVAPAILAQRENDWPTLLREAGAEEIQFNPRRIEPTSIPVDHIDRMMPYNDTLTPTEILRIWQETGIFIYTR